MAIRLLLGSTNFGGKESLWRSYQSYKVMSGDVRGWLTVTCDLIWFGLDYSTRNVSYGSIKNVDRYQILRPKTYYSMSCETTL